MPTNASANVDLPREPIAGRYRVRSLLGRGGVGSVYEAVNVETGAVVAVKTLRAEIATDANVIQRFVREARITQKLDHPNIVRVIEMGQDPSDGSLFLATELLHGGDMREMLEERGKIEVDQAIELLVPIMGALVSAHQYGVIHRDIKPENILLSKSMSGRIVPKLIDFGMSKMSEPGPENLRLTKTGMPVGTPFYMSPEQVRGERSLDERSDIWSIGTVIFEALTGRYPYEATNFSMLMYKIMTETPTRIEQVLPQIPAAFADVLHGALQPDRDRRYHTMRDFLQAVVACRALAEFTGQYDITVRHKESLRDLTVRAFDMAEFEKTLFAESPMPLIARVPVRPIVADYNSGTVPVPLMRKQPLPDRITATPVNLPMAPKPVIAPTRTRSGGTIVFLALLAMVLAVGTVLFARSRSHPAVVGPVAASAAEGDSPGAHGAMPPSTSPRPEILSQPTAIPAAAPPPSMAADAGAANHPHPGAHPRGRSEPRVDQNGLPIVPPRYHGPIE